MYADCRNNMAIRAGLLVLIATCLWHGGFTAIAVAYQQDDQSEVQATPREQLRFSGKSFDEWRDQIANDLNQDFRLEGLRALEAFAERGYAREAIDAMLDATQAETQDGRTPHASYMQQAGIVVEAAGESAVPQIHEELDADNMRRRVAAIYLLGATKLQFEEAVEERIRSTLIDATQADASEVGAAAVRALAYSAITARDRLLAAQERGQPIDQEELQSNRRELEAIEQAMTDEAVPVRIAAISTYYSSNRRPGRTYPLPYHPAFLEAALADDDELQMSAIRGLAELNASDQRRFITALEEALSADNDQRKRAAAETLLTTVNYRGRGYSAHELEGYVQLRETISRHRPLFQELGLLESPEPAE